MSKFSNFISNHTFISKITLLVLPFVCALFCIGIGRYNLSVTESLSVLISIITNNTSDVSEQAYSVITSVRLPRIILALFIGAGLSVAGAAFQAIFRNPLVTPDTLGVASGSCFGAVVALLIGFSAFGIQILALLFGLAAIVLVYSLSLQKDKSSTVMIILAGVIISSLFGALVSMGKYIADPEEHLPTITFWLMGSFSSISYKAMILGIPFIVLGIMVIFAYRWKLNVLSLSDQEAHALGVNVKVTRYIVIFAATIITASAISMSGQVGWVGLIVPHIVRMIVGNDNKFIIPASISLGAAFMVVVDTLARTLTAAEIPISILTAIIGAPFFILLLRRTGGSLL